MHTPSEFEKAGAPRRRNVLVEFAGFLGSNKKWWLTPIIVVILVLGVLVVAAGTGLAPFIYSLF
jgi:uncharacterized protein DUF5989